MSTPVQPPVPAFTLDMLYEVIDSMGKEELEHLASIIDEELELRQYKSDRVAKFKKEIQDEKKKLQAQLKKLKELKEMSDSESDEVVKTKTRRAPAKKK